MLFCVYKGVRQGGILSALLFAVYMDNLSIELNNLDIGAQIGGFRMNHLMYADDIALISSTKYFMDKLLNKCDTYANNNNLRFNSSKTELQMYFPCYMQNVKNKVSLKFQESKLCNTQKVRYLGYELAYKCKYGQMIIDDEPEIQKRTGDIYKRAYMIRSYFSPCSSKVKTKLFKSYFDSIYCCSLWNKIIKKNSSVRIAHNDALRIIFGLSRWCSASEAFVSRGIGNINYVIRKSVYSLRTRASESSNNLINTIMKCKFKDKTSCKLSKLWDDILYTNTRPDDIKP